MMRQFVAVALFASGLAFLGESVPAVADETLAAPPPFPGASPRPVLEPTAPPSLSPVRERAASDRPASPPTAKDAPVKEQADPTPPAGEERDQFRAAPSVVHEKDLSAVSTENPRPTNQPAMSKSMSNLLPMLEMRQKVPEQIRQGEPTQIEVIVKNAGLCPVERVVVTQSLGKEVEILESYPKATIANNGWSWTIDRLESGHQQVIALTIRAKGADGIAVLKATTIVTSQVTMISEAALVRPELTLAVEGPENASVGEPASYLIEVANVGTAPAQKVVLRDPLPNGLSHPHGPDLENAIGQLAPGESKKIRLTVTPTVAGKLINKIQVLADGCEKIEKDVEITVDELKLVVETTAPKMRYLQKPCPIEVKVINQGQIVARGVKLTATLPTGLTFTDASDNGQHDPNLHAVHWAVGDLPPGETRVVHVNGIAAKIGDQQGRVLLAAARSFNSESKWTTKVEGVSALQMELVDLEDPVEINGETTYEIRLTNQGSIPATRVNILATIPPELELIAAEGPTPNKLVNQELVFEPIESLAPKADVIVRVKVKALKGGDHRLRASVSSDQLIKPVIKEESTTAYGEEKSE